MWSRGSIENQKSSIENLPRRLAAKGHRPDMSAREAIDEEVLLRELKNSPRLWESLASQEQGETEFHWQRRLRAAFPDALVRAALTLRDLRRKATVKFTRAEQMWFTPAGLEQATSEPVARHKAKRFNGVVWD